MSVMLRKCSKSGTYSVPANVTPGRGTNRLKIGTSRRKRDGWQPYKLHMKAIHTMVRQWSILPSIRASVNWSLYCGSPISSNHPARRKCWLLQRWHHYSQLATQSINRAINWTTFTLRHVVSKLKAHRGRPGWVFIFNASNGKEFIKIYLQLPRLTAGSRLTKI